jgi:branched-chain amino acid aminotransferase
MQPSALQIEQTPEPKKMLPASQLQFGHSFTDHMLLIPWSHSTGWGAPTIKPYGPLNLDPSSTVLHYACTLFEGMKAYRDAESGRVSLFRPDKNMARMNSSAARLAFPVGFYVSHSESSSIPETRADLPLPAIASRFL